MAKVNIQKGNMTKQVSRSLFENFFQNSGWVEVGVNPTSPNVPEVQEGSKNKEIINNKANEEEVNLDQSGTSEDDEWAEVMNEEEEDIEKPLSEMNRDELIQYAKDHDISLAGLTKNAQFREAIKAAMNEV